MHEKTFIEFCDKLDHASHTVLEKADTIYKNKSGWTVEELGKFVDILKDLSEISKNVAKTHYLLSEHSIERY